MTKKAPTLGERMKRYEHQTRHVLPKRTYTLVRLDGRAFHSYTRGLDRPFDLGLVEDMDGTAVELCRAMAGAEFAYVQSDEISVLLTDFENHGTEPWMGGVLQKVVSLSASEATLAFNLRRLHRAGPGAARATFDSRAWTVSDPNEVMNYFVWRQRDCVKNSVTMAALSVCGHRELEGLDSNQRQEMAWRRGLNWNSLDPGLRRGRLVRRVETEPQPGVTRSSWEAGPAPRFDGSPAGWLASSIPPMPGLPREAS